jgi:hypothetical protein
MAHFYLTMSKQDSQLLDLMEKLFEAKLEPIRADIKEINKAINGNGHKGILDRLTELEGFKLRVYTIYGVLATIFLIIGVYIKNFVEQVYSHIK